MTRLPTLFHLTRVVNGISRKENVCLVWQRKWEVLKLDQISSEIAGNEMESNAKKKIESRGRERTYEKNVKILFRL